MIYIRTSSETQVGKSSPSEQEVDCQRLAKQNGLEVVRIYRDVEKYRVGNKLVEPSGSRSDRPALQSMLADAARNNHDSVRFLLALAEQEVNQRQLNMLQQRLKNARFPVIKELADFDFSCLRSIKPKSWIWREANTFNKNKV